MTYKKGGGVDLYIDISYESKSVSNVNHYRQCHGMSVEIEINKSKNILISCVYRRVRIMH